MPAHMNRLFSRDELLTAELVEPLSFTKGLRVLRTRANRTAVARPGESLLYDLEADPKQDRPIRDAAVERRMTEALVADMKAANAPGEQFQRFGL